jgi:outer membrane protein insertion porin family
MTKLIYSYLIIAFIVCTGNLFGQSLQFENQLVEKINVEVANLPSGAAFDGCSVTSRIKTREGSVFSQIEFDNDLKILVQEFDSVDPVLVSIEDKLHITLKIWPKPTIRTIFWEGNHKISTKRLTKELNIPICSVFDRQAFNKAFHKLKAYYVKKGHFEATLNYTVALDPVTNEVDITVCVHEGRAGRIKEILFNGFCPEEECELLQEMVTKKYNLFTSWFNDEGTYNEEAIQQDRFVILNYLHNEGYSDATIDLDVCEAEQRNRIVITITAERGEQYSFGKICFKGNKLFDDELIGKMITFSEGSPYSPEAIRETVKLISECYGRKGYIDAIVDYETDLNCEDLSYALNFEIEEGEQFCVGLIKVFGNCSTKTNVILHETLLIPGEIFNIAKLQVTEERLKNIGYFKNVNVYAVKSEGPDSLGGHYRDVHIEVEETITGNFSAGFGFSSVESIFGEFSITEKNFNYRGFENLFSDGYKVLRGGGEYVRLSALFGAKSRKYSLSWTKPFFMDTPWVVGFELEQSNNRYVSSDYAIDASSATIHGSYPVNQFVRLGLHYRLRNTWIDIEQSHPSCQLKDEARNSGLISAAGITLSYDSTNHPVEPSKGFKSRLEEEFAGIGGDHTFLSLAYLNSYYIPVGEKGVIRLRGDMRFIVPLFNTERNHLPIDERLFLGGENTIRGYKSYRLGPQYNEGDPRGGMSMQLLSIEYTRNLMSRLDAFIFCDSGHLSMNVWNFGTMWTSAGFGIRVQVFEGTPPLVMGVGFPFNPDHRHDVKQFFFTIGGRF